MNVGVIQIFNVGFRPTFFVAHREISALSRTSGLNQIVCQTCHNYSKQDTCHKRYPIECSALEDGVEITWEVERNQQNTPGSHVSFHLKE